jgi:hypothetical protein
MIYVKIIVILGLFALGYYFGGLRSKAALEGLQAAQSSNTAKAVLAQKSASDAEETRLNGVIAKYEATPIDPVVTGLASGVYHYARIADCPVSKTSPLTSGTGNPAAGTASDPSFVGLAQAVLNACDHDAHQVIALQQAWPR